MTFVSLRITAALLAMTLAVVGCGKRADEGAPARYAVPERVHVAEVTKRTAALTLTVVGTLLPRDRAHVSARVSGQIVNADFAVGQQVAQGQLVLRIRADEYGARLEQAKAALAQVNRELVREKDLHARGVSAIEAVRTLEDRARIAESAVAEAEAILSYTALRAPFAGKITRKFAHTGDIALAGSPLFAIEAPWPLRAEVEVPASLAALPLGARVELESGEKRVTGALVELSSAADVLSRTRLAKIDIPGDDPAFRSGQFVRAFWPAGETDRLILPTAALGSFGQLERVFVLDGNRARLRLIRTGSRLSDGVEILSGLSAGERVVLSPPTTLRDGQHVEVAP